MKTVRTLITSAMLAAILKANAAFACAACYGKSDSPMAKGMNAGILSLLGVVGVVLAGAASFFVFLARRSAAVAKNQTDSPSK
jgi:hypothetical protein